MLAKLVSLLSLTLPVVASAVSTELTFGPQHDYNVQLRSDGTLQTVLTAPRDRGSLVTPTWSLRAQPTTIPRPKSPEVYQEARLMSLRHAQNMPVEWEDVTVMAPDVQDMHTLSQLARMTGNAYSLPGQKSWYDIDPAWNIVSIHAVFRKSMDAQCMTLVELSLRVGGRSGWLPWACLPLCRQLDGRTRDQGHDGAGAYL